MSYYNFSNETLWLLTQDANKVKLLSKDEEQELFKHAKAGSKKARDRLMRANIRFVLKVAIQHKHSPIPLPDLVNEGMMGLNRAIDDFNPSSGNRFISYAVWWIRCYITRAINETGYYIRLPANNMLAIRRKAQSIKEEMADVGQRYRDDVFLRISDEREQHLKMDTHSVKKLLEKLEPREAKVLMYVYGIGDCPKLNYREISDVIGLSHERVRQVKITAMNKLKSLTGKEKNKWN
jgi:RNA polymerase primary sigma factor